MTALQYDAAAEAAWLVMTAGSQVLYLDGATTSDQRNALWNALCSTASAQDVLDELTRGGISKAPAFGLITVGGDLNASKGVVHAIVRGTLSVTIHNEDGAVLVVGDGRTTWAENTVKQSRGFEVAASGSTRNLTSANLSLPLTEGMAIASHVSVGSTAPKDAPSVAVSGSASQPDPQPEVVRPKKHREPEAPPQDAPTVVEVSQSSVAEVTVSEVAVPVQGSAPSQILDPFTPPPGSTEDSGYDYLFGETIARTVEDAAIRESAESPHEGAPEQEGDHDGKTSIGLDRAARKAARQARADRANATAPAPVTMFIALSTGLKEMLDQPIIIGRAPSVSQVSGTNLPRLLTIAGPDQDISRNHLQVALEGGTVVVTDLHSKNGTMIVIPGMPPRQLRAGEPTPVILGTTVDLGSGVSFTVGEQ